MSTMTSAEIESLVNREQAQPHAFLGAHEAEDGVVFSVCRPALQAVTVLLDEGQELELDRIHAGGFFEGTLAGAKLPLAYRLRLDYAAAGSFEIYDPYAFTPTLGELDLHLIAEGRDRRLYDHLGAHVREHTLAETVSVTGTAFAVWAPSARSVSVVGDFNGWDGRIHPLRSLGSSGVWELFVPESQEGSCYKFEILTQDHRILLKADPMAQETEMPPQTASKVTVSRHQWGPDEDAWIESRRQRAAAHTKAVSIYEVHLGSWRWNTLDGNRSLSYLELADELADYVQELGFTHVELMPVMAHPFAGSWGYQVTGYFAPTPRFGSPDDLRVFIERMHQRGIGVVLDWVPAHFPRDEFALARFDGTALYEHADPRRGTHPDWGTLVFNFGRHEVRNFLIADALYWLREFHADGIRVDAVASMLYRDYSREEGEWIPNEFGGREDLEAVSFLKELNEAIYSEVPGAISAAEESTSWTGVSRPTYLGGLGFGFKWNMGWMHDTLEYFGYDPVYRRYHHNELTFSLIYAFSENFILPLSHDEVVHGKGSLYESMAGDHWQKLANLRTLYAYMWSHPGKKLLFMGNEFAQTREWSADRSLDWHLLDTPDHGGMQRLIRDLNVSYRSLPALWELDSEPGGFYWLESGDAEANVLAYARQSSGGKQVVVIVLNLAPVVHENYRIGLPRGGRWRELVNSDATVYGGSGVGNLGSVQAENIGWSGQQHSAALRLPPLGALWLVPEDEWPEPDPAAARPEPTPDDSTSE